MSMDRAPMTDAELLVYLGIQNEPADVQARIMATMTPQRRAITEKMRDIELWDQGFGPKPSGVFICGGDDAK